MESKGAMRKIKLSNHSVARDKIEMGKESPFYNITFITLTIISFITSRG